MARYVTTLDLDMGAIVTIVGGQSKEAARRAAEKTLQRARSNLSAAGRNNTGALQNSLMVMDITGNPMVPSFAIGSGLEYAIYQEVGTGGSRARPGGFLRFKPKGSSTFVFAKQTRGFPGANYLGKAVAAVTASDFS
jgi:hypothetical protein